MTTRRDFILFVGCALIPQAHAQTRRREVRVAGRRIKTIDVHAHCVIPEAQALMKQKPAGDYALTWEERLRRMDEQGIDVEALSINPTWYALERDLVTKVIDLQNEKLAELCAQHPDRLVAFASVALQYPDLAAQQLEQAVKKLGLRGAAIGGSVEGAELADPKFHPFWAKAEELGVLIFLHPQRTSDLKNRLRGNGYLEN
ncbi:MAG TPA: amidohydrolase family protein, partial [Burkholderiales bacterium]|nr:amidohydrolase family protein [Burkholderiales bacterium]